MKEERKKERRIVCKERFKEERKKERKKERMYVNKKRELNEQFPFVIYSQPLAAPETSSI